MVLQARAVARNPRTGVVNAVQLSHGVKQRHQAEALLPSSLTHRDFLVEEVMETLVIGLQEFDVRMGRQARAHRNVMGESHCVVLLLTDSDPDFSQGPSTQTRSSL